MVHSKSELWSDFTAFQSIILNALETGGTGTFSYQWYTVANNVITSISNATVSTLTVSPNKTASYEVQMTDIGTNANATPTERALSLPDNAAVISSVTVTPGIPFYVPVTITNSAPAALAPT